jgi:hypothetical protein
MNDRELLELAAKAADLCVLRIYGHTDGKLYDAKGKEWNPLADDGDALRLAVKLGMMDDPKRVHVTIMWNLSELKDDDPYAQVRRAIVRTAAEMGKAMQEGATARKDGL